MFSPLRVPISRLQCVVKRKLVLENVKNVKPVQLQSRSSGHDTVYTYRKGFHNTADLKFAVFLGATAWWWILWHFFTEYEEFIGTRPPNPEAWTDEELGIPPDDAD